MTQAARHPQERVTKLDEYAADEALAGLRETLLFYRREGMAVRGEPQISPEVTSVELEAKPPRVSISDCYDSTDLEPYYVESGQPARIPKQNLRYRVTAQAKKINGDWHIVRLSPHRSQSC